MRKEHVIVDAWNLIHFDLELRRVLKTESQVSAARGLLKKLEAFCLYDGRRLSIVYDGVGDEISISRPTPSPDLSEIYTPSSMTADEFIESFCALSKKPSEIIVATADRLLSLTVSSFGATAIEPELLFSAAEASEKSMRGSAKRENFLNDRLWARVSPFDGLDLLKAEIDGMRESLPLMSKRMKKKYKRQKKLGCAAKDLKSGLPKREDPPKMGIASKHVPAKVKPDKAEALKFSFKLGMGAPSDAALEELKESFSKTHGKKRSKSL